MLVEATVEAPKISKNWFLLLVETNPFCYEGAQSKWKKKRFFFFFPYDAKANSLLSDYWKSVISKSQKRNPISSRVMSYGPCAPHCSDSRPAPCPIWPFTARFPSLPYICRQLQNPASSSLLFPDCLHGAPGSSPGPTGQSRSVFSFPATPHRQFWTR